MASAAPREDSARRLIAIIGWNRQFPLKIANSPEDDGGARAFVVGRQLRVELD
jgi:hypothetical protein